MDYCASCRRHLNGALSCPGCGASNGALGAPPQYRRPADPYRAEAVAYPSEEPWGGQEPLAGEEPWGGQDRYAPEAEPTPPAGRAAAPAGPSGHGGRASRASREQVSRRRPKRRRGALVLAVAGLAIGGLGAAVVSSGHSDGATTPASSLESGQPLPGGEAIADPASGQTRAGAQGSPGAQRTGTGRPSASGSSSAGASASPSSSGQASASAPVTAATAPGPGASSPHASAPPQPSTAPPSPSPTPKPTCTRVLFWCS